MTMIILADGTTAYADNDLLDAVIASIRDLPPRDLIHRLDPRHAGFSDHERLAILHARYHQQLIADGLESGHFTHNSAGQIVMSIQQPLPSVAGYIFEALTVRVFNDQKPSVGKQAFLWATGRRRVTTAFLEQFHAAGVGHLSTRGAYQSLYNPTLRQFDVIFFRLNRDQGIPEPATILNTTIPAGIQVKAVMGSENDDIIQPILRGQYRRVLTYLQHLDGRTSYEACLGIARSLHRAGQIRRDQLETLEEAIIGPEALGIDRGDVNHYYEYIQAWYNHKAEADENILRGVGLPIKEQRRGSSFLTSFTGRAGAA